MWLVKWTLCQIIYIFVEMLFMFYLVKHAGFRALLKMPSKNVQFLMVFCVKVVKIIHNRDGLRLFLTDLTGPF